jgi:very-short-patch-repair endonuclease
VPVGGGERGLAWVATRQHGCVSVAQLHVLGCSRHAISHRVAQGRLHPLHRGVHLLGADRPTTLGRYAAALLATGPSALSHRPATTAWDLLPSSPAAVDVTTPRARRPRHDGIIVHRSTTLAPDEIRRRHGLPVTSPARTLLDLAATAPRRELERAVAEAHVRGLARREELEAMLARHAGHPGVAALRAAAQGTRSRPERDLLALCAAARLPRPQVNTRVEGFEVDAYWPEQRFVVEVDSFGTHGHAAAFAKDRHRDLVLQAAGITVLRVTDRQLAEDRLAVAATLAATR